MTSHVPFWHNARFRSTTTSWHFGKHEFLNQVQATWLFPHQICHWFLPTSIAKIWEDKKRHNVLKQNGQESCGSIYIIIPLDYTHLIFNIFNTWFKRKLYYYLLLDLVASWSDKAKTLGRAVLLVISRFFKANLLLVAVVTRCWHGGFRWFLGLGASGLLRNLCACTFRAALPWTRAFWAPWKWNPCRDLFKRWCFASPHLALSIPTGRCSFCGDPQQKHQNPSFATWKNCSRVAAVARLCLWQVLNKDAFQK